MAQELLHNNGEICVRAFVADPGNNKAKKGKRLAVSVLMELRKGRQPSNWSRPLLIKDGRGMSYHRRYCETKNGSFIFFQPSSLMKFFKYVWRSFRNQPPLLWKKVASKMWSICFERANRKVCCSNGPPWSCSARDTTASLYTSAIWQKETERSIQFLQSHKKCWVSFHLPQILNIFLSA